MEKQTKTFKKPKFFNGLTKCKPVKKENLHNEFIDQYEELAPFAHNKETGEILNKTDKYIYKKIAPRNIYKEIQSQAKEADIVQKIKNMTPASFEEMKNKKGVYIDNTKISNIHEEHLKTQKLEKELALAEKAYKAKQEELKNAKIIEKYKQEEAAKAAALKEKELKHE